MEPSFGSSSAGTMHTSAGFEALVSEGFTRPIGLEPPLSQAGQPFIEILLIAAGIRDQAQQGR